VPLRRGIAATVDLHISRPLASLLLLIAFGGCASGGAGADDWSRSYLSSPDSVLQAVLDALEGEGFHLDAVDAGRGRVSASSSARRGDDLSLIVQIEQHGGRIRVDVMARSQQLREGGRTAAVDAAVRSFFRRLDTDLEGRGD
jgi:hypothetical protein